MKAIAESRHLLLGATAVSMAVLLWMVFFWVPTETEQGAVQRILYFHVPIAIVSMGAIVVVAVASVLYLRTKAETWDRLAASTAEVGLLFGGLMLLTGMIWARPVWQVWWTGEAKLTTALILFFIYVAYLMFRAYMPTGTQRQRLAAIIAIIGAVDTPIIYFASKLWEQSHPPPIVGPAADPDAVLGRAIGFTLLAGMLAFLLLFALIVIERYRMRQAEDAVTELRRNAPEPSGAAG